MSWVLLAFVVSPAIGSDGASFERALELLAKEAWAAAASELTAVAAGAERELLTDARQLNCRALVESAAHEKAIAVCGAGIDDTRLEKTQLPDRLLFQRGLAHEALGHTAEALADFTKVALDPFATRRDEAAFHAALATHKLDPAQALKSWVAFNSRYPASTLAREGQLRVGKLLVETGKLGLGLEYLFRIVREAPGTKTAEAARQELLVLKAKLPQADPDSTWERWRRIELLMSDRDFDAARPFLEAHREWAKAGKRRKEEIDAVRYLARVANEQHRPEEALQHYAWLADEAHVKVAGPEILATLHAQAGHMAEAEQILASRFHGKTKNYWRRLGDLRYEFGEYAGAYAAYRKTQSKKARPTRRMVWALMLTGKASEAAEHLRKAGTETSVWRKYWHARALTEAGEKQQALEIFGALKADQPLTYYGILAASRVAEIEGTAPAPGIPVAVAEGAVPVAPTCSVEWSPASLSAAYDQVPKMAPRQDRLAALATFAERWGELAPEARRALELERQGQTDEAMNELRVIDMDLRQKQLRGTGKLINRARTDILDNRMAQMGRAGAPMREPGRRDRKQVIGFARKAREIRDELRVVQALFADPYALRRSAYERGYLGKEPVEETLDRWKNAFPIAWPELVKTFATQYKIPPYFAYAIMTVESGFHPYAVSVAHAYGLLQVIPRTGRRIANEIGFVDFTPERLLEPEVSIYFGSHYLGALLQKFAGQEQLAAAAYNCGPHRVDMWLRRNPKRPLDLFVEEIPFDQPRNYAKRIIEHIARYRRIYHGEGAPYVTNRLVGDCLALPNY
jgi:soluble lytic murein transglycosylase-like protein